MKEHGTKRVRGSWRNLHIEEIHNTLPLFNIIKVRKQGVGDEWDTVQTTHGRDNKCIYFISKF
jgi:hypothetical protein